jgi:hypothetical protein
MPNPGIFELISAKTGLNTTGATLWEHAIIEPEEKIIAT